MCQYILLDLKVGKNLICLYHFCILTCPTFPILCYSNDKTYNAPPSDISVQEIPRSLKEFILLKESAKNSQNDRQKVKSRSTKLTIPEKPSKSNTSKITKKGTSLLKNQTVFNSVFNTETDVVECRKSKMKQKKKMKLMKLKEKRKQKKLNNKLEIEQDKSEIVKENIKFGDVVHRPPQLSVLPRKVAQSGFQRRVSNSLFLKES